MRHSISNQNQNWRAKLRANFNKTLLWVTFSNITVDKGDLMKIKKCQISH